jgi:glutamate 5-kinase
VVVKVGSSTLTDRAGRLDLNYIRDLSAQISRQVEKGFRVTLVTSGAIRAGAERLALSGRPRTLPEKQAAAAVGQGLLLQTYTDFFAHSGITAAQILLTRDDFHDRTRYLNARNTLNALLDLGCVPIVNENDTVAVEEIRFGDNDSLAAMVAAATDADTLIILSDVEGMYDGTPDRLIREVREITPEIEAMAGGAGSIAGTGGMFAKVQAAKIAMNCGVTMVIASGRRENVIADVLEGGEIGTWFYGRETPLALRKRWIAFGAQVRGAVTINEGARKMIADGGKSLLPAGLIGIEGDFESGDLVAIQDEAGDCVAKGLTNYSSGDLHKIHGLKTAEIEGVLGSRDFDEVIHRDNMVLGV